MGRWDRDGAGQGYARAEVGWMDQDAVGLLIPWGHLLTRTLVPFGAVGYCYFRKGGSFQLATRARTPLSPPPARGPGGQVTVLAVALENVHGRRTRGGFRDTDRRAGRQGEREGFGEKPRHGLVGCVRERGRVM